MAIKRGNPTGMKHVRASIYNHYVRVDQPKSLIFVSGQVSRDDEGNIVGGTSMLEQMFSGMTRVDTMRSTLLRYVRDSHRPTVANAMREIIVTDMRPELARITAPVTVLYVLPSNLPISPSEFDTGVRQSWSNLPGVRLVKVGDSNHFIQVDQPARFVAEVDAFMR